MKLIADQTFIRMCRSMLVMIIPAWVTVGLCGFIAYLFAKAIGHQSGLW